jgi:hypothetical protein
VAGLSPRRPGFDPGSVHVGFVVDKVVVGHVFPRSTSVFHCSFHSTDAPLHGKKLIIFIIGLHSKPEGCGASVASAAGPCCLHASKARGHVTRVQYSKN